MRHLMALLALLAIFAIACDDGDGDVPAATGTPEGPHATATEGAPPTDAAAPTPFVGSREPVEKPVGDVTDTPLLVDVRAASHDGFDRVVFEFDLHDPGFRAEYVDEAIACGSGNVVEIDGAALLQVRITPVAAHNEAGEPTFPQQELSPGLPSILEAEQTCDFEAEVTWVLGLAQEVDFNAISLREPFRVVVDVAHP